MAVVREYVVAPEEFGLLRAPLSALEGGDAAANAAILRAIFAGERGPRRDVVLLNAAAVLVAAGWRRRLSTGLRWRRRQWMMVRLLRLVDALGGRSYGVVEERVTRDKVRG